MIEVLSGFQLVFTPLSHSDQRLKADLRLKNPNKDRQIAFKIKSTDISAFEAQPNKGLIQPQKQLIIPIITRKSVDAEYAKILASKNKFLVEYVLLSTKYSNVDDALSELRGPTSQNVKIYINTNSVRGSSQIKSSKQPSISGTNRYSFHSMVPNTNTRLTSDRMIEEYDSDQLSKLRESIDLLEKKRTRLSKQIEVKAKHKSEGGGFLKYIIVLAIGLIAGNLASHHTGVNKYLNDKFEDIGIFKKKEVKKEEEGFLSILNFWGNEEEE